jgi:cytochrome c biogenesis protein CcmG/thiol:disulfide interchange protein DsbE
VVKSFLILSAVLLLSACGESTPPPQNGTAPPAFELPLLDGGKSRFPDDYSNRLVAIRFWADWCPFCESEMQALQPVFEQYRERGLSILAVNVRQEQETAAAFIRKLGVDYPVLLDLEGEVARGYGVLGLPTTYFVDRDGRLIGKIIGESTPQMFLAMLKGKL